MDNEGQWHHLCWHLSMELLHEHHMEHVVNPGLGRQLEVICYRSDALQHLVGTIVARCELGVVVILDGHDHTLVKAQPHPIADLKGDCTVPTIMSILHVVLCLEYLSTTTGIALAEPEVGKPSTKSIEIISHEAFRTGKGLRRHDGYLERSGLV